MPKVGMEPIRRKQLIEATLLAIHEHGWADATVARIAKNAGVSTGIVHHYFGGKDDLLEATMRTLLRAIAESSQQMMRGAGSARQRALAVIRSNFADDQFTPQAVTAWLAFWAQVPHSPRLARLQKANEARLRSNLVYAMKQCLPDAAAREVAEGLSALIDGLWLRCAMTKEGLAPEDARAITIGFLDRSLPADELKNANLERA